MVFTTKDSFKRLLKTNANSHRSTGERRFQSRSLLNFGSLALRDGSFEIELAHTPSCMFERGINLSSIILEYFLFYFFLFSSSDCMQWMSVRRTPSGPSEVSA